MTAGARLGVWPSNPPQSRQLIAVIRTLARDVDILLLDHAEERMQERDIDMIDVRRVLASGDIIGPVEPGISDQEWKCKVVASPRYPESGREIGVVTIVVRASRLILKTVEWEDET